MDKLILQFKNRVVKEYPFTGNLIKIGRDADNDIIIENVAISRHHAKVERLGEKYILSDLNSTNGTFLNEKKIKKVELKDGDKIITGKHTIVFESASKAQKHADVADFGGTVILNTAQQKDLLAKQKPTSAPEFEEKQAKLIIFQSGERKEYKLTKETTIIGKSETADVVLVGFMTPKVAATITKKGESYHISGYGGWIKVNVNDRIAGKNWKLYNNDAIEIRNCKIIFECK